MARRKNPGNDLKFEIVQGEEMTEEDLDAIGRILARLIYDKIMKEQESQQNNNSNQDSNRRDDQSSLTIKS